MNTNYLYDYVDLLEKVLSYGHKHNYSTSTIERSVSYSPFFMKIESNEDYFGAIVETGRLIHSIFPEKTVFTDHAPTYIPCLWAAEAYIRIQEHSKLTFEAIFLYLPIEKMYELFPLYHEMDFSKTIFYFDELVEKQPIFAILLKRYKYTLKYVFENTGISYQTLASLKQRRRDIKKMNIESLYKLSKLFKVRIETLAEIKLS